MPAELAHDPLTVRWVDGDGVAGAQQVRGEANPALARDLAEGLVGLVHPHGPVGATDTIESYLISLRHAVAWFREPRVGSAADLTRAQLAEYLMGTGFSRESHVRRMLVSFDAVRGELRGDVRALLAGRAYNTRGRKQPLAPYSETAWAALTDAARRACTESFGSWREAMALAEHGRDPLVDGFTLENACWHVRNRGPGKAADFAGILGKSPNRFLATTDFTGTVGRAMAMLLPTAKVLAGYQVLFGIYTGVVPDGIADLDLGDLEWAGDAALLLTYAKGRTSTESVTLGAKPIRLLERWLEHSALARTQAPQSLREALWIRYETGGSHPGWATGPVPGPAMRDWAAEHQVRGEDGAHLSIHRHRIRTTFHALRDRRAWTGSSRTLIDPNHSPRVEADSYLGTPTAAQREALEEIITAGQAEVLRKARPAAALTGEQAADFAERFPDLVAAARLDDAAIRALVGGERDVFAASCADHLAGQFGAAGRPCPARPWVCLLCPLALFAPRHLPNLLRLGAYFDRAFQAMTVVEFMAVFGYYAQRVEQILDVFRASVPALVDTASCEVADHDDELPLRPEERTA
ncbi:MAG TPA: hypothetical protein VGX23_01610 [Actinocrinis sp.]|nr:hypothetical protein [Actinocrinis sp.]